MSKYMGQIMAECDCQHCACEQRGYCMADRIEQLAAINEELEAKLAKARTFLGELWDSQGYDARELHDLLKELDGDKQ